MKICISKYDMKGLEVWEEFDKVLNLCVDEQNKINNIQWFVYAHQSSLSSNIYSSQFISKAALRVLDFNEYKSFKRSAASKIEKRLSSSFMGSCINLEKSHTQSKIQMVLEDPEVDEQITKAKKHDQTIVGRYQKRRSAKDELKKIIFDQLYNSENIVKSMVNSFCSEFERLYINSKDKIDSETRATEILNEMNLIVLNFVKILRDFIGWVYDMLLQNFQTGLDHEDLDSNYIIEAIIYQFLFSGSNTYQLLKIFEDILDIQMKIEIQSFNEVLLRRKNDSLIHYDEVFQKSKLFLLVDSPKPYQEAINLLNELNSEKNPYLKFENVVYLEQAIYQCAAEYYANDNEMLKKIKNSYSMDFKCPILEYCLIQTQNKNLIKERKLIEMFLEERYKESMQFYIAFNNSFDFVIGNISNE